MGLLKKRKPEAKPELKEKPTKKVEKKETVVTPVKEEKKELPLPAKEKWELVIEPKKPETENKPTEENKNYWEGIGIVGTNDIVNTFRATARYKKEKVGKLLCDFMKEYNQKNKF